MLDMSQGFARGQKLNQRLNVMRENTLLHRQSNKEQSSCLPAPRKFSTLSRTKKVVFVDIRFTDMPGVQQHFNLPAKAIDDDFFVNGQLFDGSSIRGFQGIAESDMQLEASRRSVRVR